MHRHVQGTEAQPAAGADTTIVTIPNDSFRVDSVHATLTTGAAVANRYPHFQFISQAGLILHEVVAHTAQAASQIVAYDLVVGGGNLSEGSAVNDGVVSLPLPDIWWPAGTTLIVKTTAIAAADQWSAINYSIMAGEELEHLRLLAEIAGQLGG